MTPWSQIAAATRAEHDGFLACLDDPERAQAEQLARILGDNRESEPGRRYRFDRIRDADDFREQVPVHRYEDLRTWLRATCDGLPGQAVSAPALMAERTSGSTGTARLVPYTAASLGAFQRALHPWLGDLIARWPALDAGRAYFALSPAARPAATGAREGALPVGAASDAVYFGEALADAFLAMSAVPPVVTGIPDVSAWRYLTALGLLAADDLTLISVWSPTFALTLLDGLDEHAETLVADLRNGTVTVPGASSVAGPSVYPSLRPRPRRAATLRAALAGPRPDTAALWPRLTLLSCWCDAGSARFVPALRRAFPGVPVQGKGLLATEGAVSVPMGDAYPVLALNSGFFEFVDGNGRSRLAHELTSDTDYQVLITTPGGLYRYDLGDTVRVRGFRGATPTLEFLGRAGRISDLCGEKLAEAQVQAGLAGCDGFAMLAPGSGEQPGYRLLLDEREHAEGPANALALTLDERLRGNPHYDHARRLGQLAPIRPDRRHRPLAAYLRWQSRRGQRLGDIKPPVLYRELDWPSMFEPHRDPHGAINEDAR